jgi:outer membrane immunogenic protein
MVHKIVAFALSLALLPAAQQASAQSTSFRGLRAEAQAGLDRFYSEGEHDHSFGYGAMVGFDGTIGDRFVMGAEGTYWQADGRNVTPGVVRRSLEEWGVAVRPSACQ